MFTGIVEELGKILKIDYEQEGRRFTIDAKEILNDIKKGDSIAVDGACLTVENFGKNYFIVYAMPETIKKTTFKNIKTGQLVNLERALALNSRLGGHFVLGHIDTTGSLIQINKDEQAKILKITITQEYSKFLVSKGSICVNGVSLTIVDAGKDFFTVSIIPFTQQVTNLNDKKVHDELNIEFDILAKHVARLISPMESTGVTKNKLMEFGII